MTTSSTLLIRLLTVVCVGVIFCIAFYLSFHK